MPATRLQSDSPGFIPDRLGGRKRRRRRCRSPHNFRRHSMRLTHIRNPLKRRQWEEFIESAHGKLRAENIDLRFRTVKGDGSAARASTFCRRCISPLPRIGAGMGGAGAQAADGRRRAATAEGAVFVPPGEPARPAVAAASIDLDRRRGARHRWNRPPATRCGSRSTSTTSMSHQVDRGDGPPGAPDPALSGPV